MTEQEMDGRVPDAETWEAPWRLDRRERERELGWDGRRNPGRPDEEDGE